LINLLTGSKLAVVSSDLDGGTSSNEPYVITAPRSGTTETYTVWDTPGLNEGERGTVPARKALDNLLNLTRKTGVNLVIYCIRAGRLPDIIRVNFDSYWRIICDTKVPIILVVTGVEQELSPDDWWKRNGRWFKRGRMTFNGQVCVALKGDPEAYQRSYEDVWELVQRHCATQPYFPPQPVDISTALDTYVDKGKGGPSCVIF